MAIKQAEILTDQQFSKLLTTVTASSKRPMIDKLAFLFSFKAGLRVQEIAGLRWKENILDADGNIRYREELVPGSKGRVKRVERHILFIGSDIGKYGNARTLVMHDVLVEALREALAAGVESEWVIPSGKNGADQGLKSRAHALKMRINRTYKAMGFDKCSSHSGRRTFITKAAQRASLVGCSLKDVQMLAGHRDLTTTERYIEVGPSQADLVALL